MPFFRAFCYIPHAMPNYDYECRLCGHGFETFQRMSDDSLTRCPNCGKEGLQRLIGGGLGIIFRGSGFYVNDARKTEAVSTDGSNKQNLKETKSDSTKADQTLSSSAPENKKATA